MPREPVRTEPRPNTPRARPIESTARLMAASRASGQSLAVRPVFCTAKAGPLRESNLRSGPLAARRRSAPCPLVTPAERTPLRRVPVGPLPVASTYDAARSDDDGDDDDGGDDDSTGDDLDDDDDGLTDRRRDNPPCDHVTETIDDDEHNDDSDAKAVAGVPYSRGHPRRAERAPLTFSLVLPCNPFK
ncbi:hypothetical protein pmac_cds_24 [Pandoravirus macleodensis]|uniref:Uncharacterized protein n=1 Tax=Pandoravirus macleodensis TaxID=2107707 RepID=A0A2U7UE78_9VIRU|nr:hypothetical protein pmac_cds_24 [Pandoravirus macleodensis]AVK76712.1 hypothetical protein pmac_cds_24 [Pandoravirus macleodensis]